MNGPRSAAGYFWVTVMGLAGVVLVLVLAGWWRVQWSGLDDGDVSSPITPRLPAGLLRVLEAKAGLGQVVDELLCADSGERMRRAVTRRVDALYAPIYGRIPKLADWHYSVLGEYAELGQAAAGRLSVAWEQRLLGPDFASRLEAVVFALEGDLTATLRAAQQRVQERVRGELDLPGRWAETALGHVLAPVRADLEGRVELQAAKAGALGGTLVARKLLMTLAGKTLAAAGTKLAVKSGSKWVAGVTGGAGAAALCSVVPGIGTLVCGVGGALAVWIGFDAVAVKVDEALHREDFERDLRALVDQARRDTETELLQAFTAHIDELCARIRGRLRSLDADTLMHRLNRSPYEQIVH